MKSKPFKKGFNFVGLGRGFRQQFDGAHSDFGHSIPRYRLPVFEGLPPHCYLFGNVKPGQSFNMLPSFGQ